jgi:tetratricopeptide (TPR) repeat protein
MSSAERPPSDPDLDLAPPRDPWPSVPVFSADVELPTEQASSPSLPPLAGYEEATDLRKSGDWDGAVDAYEKLLDSSEAAEAAAQASVFASIGEVKLAQGKTREAREAYESALAANPQHMRAIDGLVGLAILEEDWPSVAEHKKLRIAALQDPVARASELRGIADIFEHRLGDLQGAADALESANLCCRGDVVVLSRLRDLYERLEDWLGFHAIVDTLCRLEGDGRARGAHRFLQAEVALRREGSEPRALAFLELALDEDPQHDSALSMLAALRAKRLEWDALAQVHERVLERLAGLEDATRAWEVLRKLAVLRHGRLHDVAGAREAFQAALELRPDDLESRGALAELLDDDAAIVELETLAALAPLRVPTYERLFELHSAAGRSDSAWLVATCLEELGVTTAAHDEAIERCRTYAPIRPRRAVDPAWWEELLRAPGADDIVCEILRIVGGAAIGLRLASKKKPPNLDPARKQDEHTTATVVRTFHWASRTLGIPTPELYAMDAGPSGIAAVQAAAPSTAIGPQVTAGMSVQQLAFLVGRHLTYYRPEHYVLVFFPSLADLSALVVAAMRVVIPAIGGSTFDGKLAERLGRDERARLERVVARLDARGGKMDLLAWIRHVELTAARAGLLLAGDLRVAMRLLKSEMRTIGDLSLDAKRGDLLAFAASRAARELRARML